MMSMFWTFAYSTFYCLCCCIKNDFANNSIRHQPLEFFCTIVERQPSIVKKDEALLKDLLELIFQLMIDIDADIQILQRIIIEELTVILV